MYDNRRRILYISARNILNKGFIGRPHYFIKALSKKYHVFIYHKPQYWKFLSRTSSDEYKDYFTDGVKIFHGYPIRIKNKYLSEIINFFVNCFRLANIIKKKRIDLVISPDIMLGIYGMLFFRKIPKIFLFDDFYPFLFGSLEQQSPSFFTDFARSIVKKLMDRSIRVSNCIISCSEGLGSYVESLGKRNVLISNGVEKDIRKSLASPGGRLAGRKDTIVMGFIGGIREYMDLGIPICGIAKLKELSYNPLLIIVGDGPYKENFVSLASRLHLENAVRFVGRVNKKEIPQYISSMDICLIPFKRNKLTDVTRPLKFFEYLACGKPIIMSEVKEIHNFFEGSMPPFVAFANGLDSFVNEFIKMVKLIKSGDMTKTLEDFSHFILAKYNWDYLSKLFVEEIDKVFLKELKRY